MFPPGRILPALLVLLALPLFPAPAGAQRPVRRAPPSPAKFQLSWHAPHGHPRARDVLDVSCGDSSARDTLYVTFDIGRDSAHVIGVDIEMRLWPTGGDTLDRHWWFESRSNPAHLTADFNVFDAPGGAGIWSAAGAGGVRTVSGPDTAFIRAVWAVREVDRARLDGRTRYVFARLIVPRPRSRDLCARPLCFELNYARMATDIHTTEIIRAGERWVSWNPRGTTPCAERVRAARVPVWRPGRDPR